jgi:SAM-dependent methyltransferase
MRARTPLERVAQLWDETTRARAIAPIQGWLDSPLVLEGYVQWRQSGSAARNWLPGLAARLRLPANGRWASLGCGSGGTEIHAAEQKLFQAMDAFDVSPTSLEQAREASERHGVPWIRFEHRDLNTIELPQATYDAIVFCMSLHHVSALEHVLDQVVQSLRPGGMLLVNEFVGPRQFQFTNVQLKLVRVLLATMPERLRRSCHGGGLKSEYVRMPIEHWNRVDPSEAVRSDEILPEIQKRFELIHRGDYGGTLLGLLLEYIIHNFDAGDREATTVLNGLFQVEGALIRTRFLPSDYTVLAARPLGARPAVRRFWRRRRRGA